MTQIAAVLILDNDGSRIAVRYFSEEAIFSDLKKQEKFETSVVSRASKIAYRNDERSPVDTERRKSLEKMEVVMVENFVVLFKAFNDCAVYLVGQPYENELMLLEAANALTQALQTLVNGPTVSMKALKENLETVFLLIDELTDSGVIMHTSPHILLKRTNMVDAIDEKGPCERVAMSCW
eukprot:Filipodium_phascolosomae@DN1745_c0_g1_i1.p1